MNFFCDELSENHSHLYLTLEESLENSEFLPAASLVSFLNHPEKTIRKLAAQLLAINAASGAILASPR